MEADAKVVRGIELQLFVRHVADVVIVDLHGRATIGRANDLLDNKLRQLIDGGSCKILLNLSDITQMDSSSISSVVRAFKSLIASWGESTTTATNWKCEAGAGDGAFAGCGSHH